MTADGSSSAAVASPSIDQDDVRVFALLIEHDLPAIRRHIEIADEEVAREIREHAFSSRLEIEERKILVGELAAQQEGTVTFYESDCSVRVVTAGEGFLDMGDHPHFARNEGAVQAVNVVTYFIPPHTTTLRKDEPQPLTCAIP